MASACHCIATSLDAHSQIFSGITSILHCWPFHWVVGDVATKSGVDQSLLDQPVLGPPGTSAEVSPAR